jgi:hypothetical protein
MRKHAKQKIDLINSRDNALSIAGMAAREHYS